mmetsp:Transcript_52999/g.124166  ORF Transcript_52999/g.124166 Transcript_52999/m.124166 type:complete len:1599 (-) Transcript_52999:80-4876(-)
MAKHDAIAQMTTMLSEAQQTGVYCSISRDGNLLELGQDPLIQRTQKHGVSIQTDGALRLHADLVGRASDFVSLVVKSADKAGAASPAAQMLRMAIGLLGMEAHERPNTLAEMWLSFEDRVLNDRLKEAGARAGGADKKDHAALPRSRSAAGVEHKDEIMEWQSRILEKLKVHIDATEQSRPQQWQDTESMSSTKSPSTVDKASKPCASGGIDGHDWGPDFMEHLNLASFILDKISTAVGVLQDPEQVDRPMILSNFTESMASHVCKDLRQWLEQLSTLLSLYHVHLVDLANECTKMKAEVSDFSAKNAELDKQYKDATMRHDRLQEQFRQSKLKGNAEIKLGITIAEEDLLIYSQHDMDDHYARWEKEEMEPIMNDLRELRNAHHDLLRKRRNDAEKDRMAAPAAVPAMSKETQQSLAAALAALTERINGKQVSDVCSRLVKALAGHSDDIKDLAIELADLLGNQTAQATFTLPTPGGNSHLQAGLHRDRTFSEGAEDSHEVGGRAGRSVSSRLGEDGLTPSASRQPSLQPPRASVDQRTSSKLPGETTRYLSSSTEVESGSKKRYQQVGPSSTKAAVAAAEKKASLTTSEAGKAKPLEGTRPRNRQTLAPSEHTGSKSESEATVKSPRESISPDRAPFKVPTHGSALQSRQSGGLSDPGDSNVGSEVSSSWSPNSTGQSWRTNSKNDRQEPWRSVGGGRGIPALASHPIDEMGGKQDQDEGPSELPASRHLEKRKTVPAQATRESRSLGSSATTNAAADAAQGAEGSPRVSMARRSNSPPAARRTSVANEQPEKPPPPPMRFGAPTKTHKDDISNTLRGEKPLRKATLSQPQATPTTAPADSQTGGDDGSPRLSSKSKQMMKGMTEGMDPAEQPPSLCLEAAKNELLYLEALVKHAGSGLSSRDIAAVLAWAVDTIHRGKSAWCQIAVGKRSITDPVRWLPPPDRDAVLVARLAAEGHSLPGQCAPRVPSKAKHHGDPSHAMPGFHAVPLANALHGDLKGSRQVQSFGRGSMGSTLNGARSTILSTAAPASTAEGFAELSSTMCMSSLGGMGQTGMASRGDAGSSSSRDSTIPLPVQPHATSWPTASPNSSLEGVFGHHLQDKVVPGTTQHLPAGQTASAPRVSLGPFDVMALQGYISGVDDGGRKPATAPGQDGRDARMQVLRQELEQKLVQAKAFGKVQNEKHLQTLEQLTVDGAQADESMSELQLRLAHMERLLSQHGVEARTFEAAMAESGIKDYLNNAGNVFERLYLDAITRMRAFAYVQTQQLDLATEVYFTTLDQVMSQASHTSNSTLPSSRGGRPLPAEEGGEGARQRASSWPSDRHANIPSRIPMPVLQPQVIPLLPHLGHGGMDKENLHGMPGSGMVPLRRMADMRAYHSRDHVGLLSPLPGMAPIQEPTDSRCHNTFRWESSPRQRPLDPSDTMLCRGQKYITFDGNSWPGIPVSHLEAAAQHAQITRDSLAALRAGVGQSVAKLTSTAPNHMQHRAIGFPAPPPHPGIAAHAAATASVQTIPSRTPAALKGAGPKSAEVLPDLNIQKMGKGGEEQHSSKEKASATPPGKLSKGRVTERMPPLTRTGGAASMPQLGKAKKDVAKAY